MKKIFTFLCVVLISSCLGVMAQDETTAEQDTVKEDYGATIRKTWEYRVVFTASTTTGTSTITSDEFGAFELGVGYNPTSWLYTGISSGFAHDFGGTKGLHGGDAIPALADLQLRLNIKKKFSLFIDGRAGIFLNITPDAFARDINGIDKTFEYPHYLYCDIQPGIIFRSTKKLDVRISFGYGYAKPINEVPGFEDRTYDETILTAKLGFGYRFK